MPYCSRCGVEVNEMAEICPLCHSSIQKFYTDPQPGREYPIDPLSSAPPRLHPKERIRIAAFMTSFGILIPLLITLAVDITMNKRIIWSIYPVISLISCWLLALLPILRPKKGRVIIWGEFIILSATLLSFRLFAGAGIRVLSMGIPILFFAALISHGVLYFSLRTSRRGSNVAGFILIGIGLFCGLTDILLSFQLLGSFYMNWSLIVMAAILPVTAMLLYLHYRKKKKTKFSKYFHI